MKSLGYWSWNKPHRGCSITSTGFSPMLDDLHDAGLARPVEFLEGG